MAPHLLPHCLGALLGKCEIGCWVPGIIGETDQNNSTTAVLRTHRRSDRLMSSTAFVSSVLLPGWKRKSTDNRSELGPGCT